MMMKKRNFILGGLAIAAAATAGLVACNKSMNDKKDDRGLTAGITAVCNCPTRSGDSLINTDIAANLHLGATKTYRLNGLVFVTNGATLTIDAGARIVGIKSTSPSIAGGGLVVTRGSKINAVGTASCPIIFTSEESVPASGDWSGIVLLGKAQTNNPGATVEGINSTAYPGRDLQYGSADSIVSGVNVNNDNSGTLKYVRIEYAGFALSLNNEINALTLAGVGRGTTLDFVEAFKSNDDSFEWFGGTVNASHLISVDALDDMFDTDNGYTGNINFALGLADTSRKDQSQSNGFENDDNATGAVVAGAPITHPHYSNVTIIGVDSVRARTEVVSGTQTLRYGRGGHMRRASRFTLNNSIVFGYNYGISLDYQLPGIPDPNNSYDQYMTAGNSTMANVFSAGYGTAVTGALIGGYAAESNGVAANGTNFDVTRSGLFRTAAIAAGNTSVRSASANPFNLGNPYVRPGIGGAITNFVPNIGQASRPFGAFPNGSNWTAPTDGCTNNNWTRYQ